MCCDDGGSDGSNRWLVEVISVLLAILSLVVVAMAVTTNNWLITEEKMTPMPDIRRPYNATQQPEPEHKFTVSGLWTVCVALGSTMRYDCSYIDYFPKEEYSPDASDSTLAIPYAVTKSAGFIFAATALLVVGEICFFSAHLSKPTSSFIVLSSGILFIVSGLLMLVGMVMYISVFKAEVGSKLRPRSMFQGPPFAYRYGYSFLFYVSGFITTELAGTSIIFVHISWQQLELIREMSKSKYVDYLQGNQYQMNNRHVHQTPVARNSSFHLCERHQKRYFCEPEAYSCQHHHHHRHNYLDYDDYATPTGMIPHDLTTETISTIADPVMHEDYVVDAHHGFTAFDLGEHLPPLPENVRSCGWKSNSFKRTMPV